MNTERIALLADSCADMPPAFVERFGAFVAPITINYADGTCYRDRVDISPEEVYARFDQEIPKTSLPLPADIDALFGDIENAGYTHVIVVTISSGLSGTHNIMERMAASRPNLTTALIDTKSIGLGAGLTALTAGELIEQGLPFQQIVERLETLVDRSKVFFCVDTLEYLYAGGRIGKATYQLGSMLNLRPIITCDDEGVYVTAAKARGRKASLKKTVELAQKALGDSRSYRIAIANGDAVEDAQAIVDRADELFPYATEILTGQISPALVVHTGKGLIGIGVQRFD